MLLRCLHSLVTAVNYHIRPQSVVAALGSIACEILHSLRGHNLLHIAPRLIDYRFSFARSHGAINEHRSLFVAPLSTSTVIFFVTSSKSDCLLIILSLKVAVIILTYMMLMSIISFNLAK